MSDILPRRLALAILAAGAVSIAAPARADGWSLTVSGWGGRSRHDELGLKHGLSGLQSQDRRDLLDGDFDTWGASALLRLGSLDVGALYQGTLLDARANSDVLTPLVGFAVDLSDTVRLDLLGELGGHRISSIGTSGSFAVAEARTTWLPYVGVRPMLSLRLPFGPLHAVLSVSPFARWDLVKRQVTVTVSDGTTTTRNTYDVGGSTFGLLGGVGIEL